MSDYTRWAAPALALIALGIGLYAQAKARRSGTPSPGGVPTIVICAAILIGTLPRALQVRNEAVLNTTSVVSLALSVAAVIVLIRATLKSRGR
jgi:hypothetical protein